MPTTNPNPWPNDTKSVATLTVEVDGTALWVSMNESYVKFPMITSAADFGPEVGLGRVTKLLDELDIKATFFVPAINAERYPDKIKALADAGHEVAHHGYRHEALGSADEQRAVLEKGISILEKVTGQRPRGYRAPYTKPRQPDHTPETPDLLLEYEFAYDSSLATFEWPYVLAEKSGAKLLELPVSWLLNDAQWFIFQPQARVGSWVSGPSTVYEAWIHDIDAIRGINGLVNLIVHPQFIGRPSRLELLRRVLESIKEAGDTPFMRCNDLAESLLHLPAESRTQAA